MTFAKAVNTCWSANGDWHAGGAVATVVAWIAVVSSAVVGELVDWPSLHAASSSTPIIEGRPTTCTKSGVISAWSCTSQTPAQIATPARERKHDRAHRTPSAHDAACFIELPR